MISLYLPYVRGTFEARMLELQELKKDQESNWDRCSQLEWIIKNWIRLDKIYGQEGWEEQIDKFKGYEL
jgi:hypothetical protein